MLVPFARTMTRAELPVLDEHGLSMWAYSVLLHLTDDPVRTQAALAESIGADKTRIIEYLDDLQDGGLITREPDPSDRRARLIGITARGRRVRDAAQAAIQRNEQRLLDQIPATERDRFLRTVRRLAALAEVTF
ncbi:MAG: MarR family winged helix-turn-helix transcriptional regulator [Jatrophihabitantaceae bacterium]